MRGSSPTHCCFKPQLEAGSILKIVKTQLLANWGQIKNDGACCNMSKQFLHIFFIFYLLCVTENAVAQTDTTDELLLKFKSRSVALTAAHKQQIAAFKKLHCGDTAWKVRVASTSAADTRAWQRLNNVIVLLTDNVKKCSIIREKIVFRYPDAMERESVWLSWDNGDEGPNIIPAPHPKNRKY